MTTNISGSVETTELPAQTETPAKTSSKLGRWLPTILWVLAALFLLASLAVPYWGMTLDAPQYPGGLSVRVFVNRMVGDEDPVVNEVTEIDGLNHYIGMRPLGEAAQLERSIAIPAVIIMSILLVVTAFWRSKWAWLLALPAIFFPFIFLGDLAYWLNNFGQNLDPAAPLSSAIKPFTPPVLGVGVVGQFSTTAQVQLGWYLALVASLLCVVAVVMSFGIIANNPIATNFIFITVTAG